MSFNCIAIDIGASNGRVMNGNISRGVITFSEITRFPNTPINVNNDMYWDLLFIYKEIINSFESYCFEKKSSAFSIGIDTFGMDFVLLNKEGRLLSNPLSQRGEHSKKGKQLYESKGKKSLFELTGIADRHFNTSFQLFYMTQNKDSLLKAADTILFIPDVLAYFLTGNALCDKSIASPGQMVLIDKTEWNPDVLDLLEVETNIFPEMLEPASNRGRLLENVIRMCNLPKDTELCFAAHDTAIALEAIPSDDRGFAFISSGTWSLMGITSLMPVINELTYKGHFSNVCTLNNDYMILKNIMGMWVLQHCKNDWERELKTILTWDEVIDAANNIENESYVDINDDLFFPAGNMIDRIKIFCKDTNQKPPESYGEVIRIVIESLAMSYKETFMELQKISEQRIDKLYIVGGGSRNKLLNQITSNLIGAEVISGPAEATVIGNILKQAMNHGYILKKNKTAIIEKSFSIEHFSPKDTTFWRNKWQSYSENR